MKLFLLFALCWLICGVAGGWMLEGHAMHFRTIAAGPVSLIRGFNETSVPSFGP